MAGGKSELRQELARRWARLWPQGAPEPGAGLRPPLFPGCNRAAERLRRLPQYARARCLAVMPEPALLQVRINCLADRKLLLAATPGLKQGFVRIEPAMVPFAQRSRALRGGSLAQAGRCLRLPQDGLGRVEMLVGVCLAVDLKGSVLGDGRGLWDLTAALLAQQGALAPEALLVVLAAEEQVLESGLPAEPWDAPAALVVTPERVLTTGAPPPRGELEDLPPRLARLPVVQAARGGRQGTPAHD